MFWILIAVCIIATLIWFFTEEYSGGFDVLGFCTASFLGAFLGLVLTFLICGLGGIIAATMSDGQLIDTSVIELAPNYTNEGIYIIVDDSDYEYLIKSETGQLESDSISATYCDIQFSNTQTPALTKYTYDFASPILRFIFWNCFNSHYVFTIPPNSVYLGPTID